LCNSDPGKFWIVKSTSSSVDRGDKAYNQLLNYLGIKYQ